MTCLVAGALVLALSAPGFSLHWTHSVEKTEWVEHWEVRPNGLRLVQARVKGSGAGMEPGLDAEHRDGWWVWSPGLDVADLHLAASGSTEAGWRLCDDAKCVELGAKPDAPVRIAPCADQ